MPLALLALAVGAFGIGTTEFVSMGLLPQVAEAFGVSIPLAGWIITAYAIGVVVGAPTLTALTHARPRRQVLLGLMVLFTVGHAATALAPTFATLVGARFLTGLAHGAFFGASAVVARALAPAGKEGRALSLVFAGLTVANVVGVPLGTWVGQQAGWRVTYALVGLIGVGTLVAVAALVPDVRVGTGSLRTELAAFGRGQVWLTLLVTVIGFGGLFTVLSYVSPLLTEVSGLSESSVSWVLVLFGLGATAGNLLGGRLSDWSVQNTLVMGMAGLVVVYAALFALASSPVAAAAGVFAFAFVAFSMSAAIQTRGIVAAGGGASMASAAMQAAFNTGNALGALLGGAVIDAGFGYASPALVAVGLSVVGLGVLALATHADSTGRAPLDPAVAAVPAQRRRTAAKRTEDAGA
ncbi:MFS transporter [Paenibacillus sp. TRM 82003]|uniref:MFS transporter n=1 Tax=Kineococcus sp. TRM81007 TaxID=2925831 RepID=UPI001F58BE4A|nr:MFS transporter [Kineococcus sp. TRM81007]MCI2239514.1 MFS transporter [Kineococcus sp. TRM81007]MCI3926205.1 MFS transporter [Paenibacillus sp. TRM 82003]